MRRYLGVILVVTVVLALLAALSAAGFVTFDRPPESEAVPQRSSYNAGPTGVRGFYQLLEESGYGVARWRDTYKALNHKTSGTRDGVLVVVGPFVGPMQAELSVSDEESKELRQWVLEGGRLLVVSRNPQAQFGDCIRVVMKSVENAATVKPEQLVGEHNELLIAQPTAMTRGVRGLQVSKLASRLKFEAPADATAKVDAEEGTQNATPAPSNLPTPTSSASPNVHVEKDDQGFTATTVLPDLNAPVVHLGDNEGAVLADFEYGKGRIIFLSDPFVIANNGVARGANLALALNVIHALGGAPGGKGRTIFFDEYHHGYESQRSSVIAYFRGTPVWWVLGQFALVAALIAYTQGRRFARPLPLAQTDRHSPLEFVGSMANLQQAAEARDLALENIYPRFRARICRALGLPVSAPPKEIAVRLKRRLNGHFSEAELQRIFIDCERVLAGVPIHDQKLIELVAEMRRIVGKLAI